MSREVTQADLQSQNWQGALVRFLDALTELAKLGTAALKAEMRKKGL